MNLQSQDLAVVLKALLPRGPRNWTYATLGEELAMSPSQVFRSVERSRFAGLIAPLKLGQIAGVPGLSSNGWLHPNRNNLKEFLVYGVRYAFPAHRGETTRGIPTAEAAAPLNQYVLAPPSSELPPVWPFVEGTCLLYTSPSPRDYAASRMPSSA